MGEKKKYESAKLELILLVSSDVITTSTTLGDGSPDYDNSAWA